jgi:hypothetical protein
VEREPHPNPIAPINDEFRRRGQGFYITQGVQALPDVPGLVGAVRAFKDFNPNNDPRGEHDMGSIRWHNERTFWKIDYYDQNLQYWCNPLSEECRRVLTILLASEY